jgi:REP element-mobilizing transposase RayT
MARKPRINLSGGLYHILARGNQRRLVFRDPRDYGAYLDRLGRYQERYRFTLLAHVLMPNHVHLLLETGSVPLSKIMQGLQQSYTQYFNKTHRSVGHCFQGRFKALLCDRDAYLLALLR